jgi:SAM-dependent methyltransferase
MQHNTNAHHVAQCECCGNAHSTHLFSGPDRLMGYGGSFSFVRCNNCGLCYQSPRLPWHKLAPYYEGDYSAYDRLVREYPSPLRRMSKRVGVLKQRWFVERFRKGGQLLDVGCGTGLFLEEMQRNKRWQLTGLEPTTRAAHYMHEQLGIPVVQETFENAHLPPESLDVITLWHVLEHVYAPRYTLRKAWQALKPGGFLFFAIPNYESLSRVAFGRHWVGWDVPRHLYIFPRPVVQRLVAEAGFRVVADECFLISYHLLGHSLNFWMQDWRGPFQPLAKSLLRLYYSPAGRLGVFPLQTLIERLGMASVTTWAVQKQ